MSISKKQASASRVLNQENMLGAGLPEPIVKSVLGIAAAHWGGPCARPVSRAQRFIDHWNDHADDSDIVGKAWKAIAESSVDVVSLFMMMPDELTDQPLAAVFGKRAVDPEAEKRNYNARLEQLRGIMDLINPQRSEFRELLCDLPATPGGQAAAAAIRGEFGPDVRRAFHSLAGALELADPFLKYIVITKQWKGARREKTIYLWRVADLGRFLTGPKPPWGALATIANINCTACAVEGDTLGRTYRRMADKTP